MNELGERLKIFNERFGERLNRIASATHAGTVSACGDELDTKLWRAIETKMRPLNSDLRQRIFDLPGSLGTLGSKIDMAYALSITTPEMRKELRKIQKEDSKRICPSAGRVRVYDLGIRGGDGGDIRS